jgi:hypothetical protein
MITDQFLLELPQHELSNLAEELRDTMDTIQSDEVFSPFLDAKMAGLCKEVLSAHIRTKLDRIEMELDVRRRLADPRLFC